MPRFVPKINPPKTIYPGIGPEGKKLRRSGALGGIVNTVFKKTTFPGIGPDGKRLKAGCGLDCLGAVFLKKPTPQEKTEAIYSNPLQITTEHAPFSPLLSEISPVIIPENPRDEQKSKLSTSGIIGVGLALAAGLL